MQHDAKGKAFIPKDFILTYGFIANDFAFQLQPFRFIWILYCFISLPPLIHILPFKVWEQNAAKSLVLRVALFNSWNMLEPYRNWMESQHLVQSKHRG